MTTPNDNLTPDPNQTADSIAQVSLFDDGEDVLFEFLEGTDFDPAAFLNYEEVPLLLVDTDPERAVNRQKEMMDYCFGGIGEERKEEKRMGLAMQQLDIEQRHALRLLLIYQAAWTIQPMAMASAVTRGELSPKRWLPWQKR